MASKAKRKTTPRARKAHPRRPEISPIGGSLFCNPYASVFTGRAKKREIEAIEKGIEFIKTSKKGKSYWAVTPTGEYGKDHAKGEEYARQFLPLLRYNAGFVELGAVVEDMVKAGGEKGRGLRLGFMHGIASRMITAAIMLLGSERGRS